jgi:hypothetical protein
LPESTAPEQATSPRDDVSSFALLGATVPFTSPRLLGARIRHHPDLRGFELVLIHPAQGKGSYVLPWRGLPEVGAPTLYDLRLWEVLSKAVEIHPTVIRRDALGVAAEGMAGRLVAKAAQEALREETGNEARLLAEFAEQFSSGAQASMSNAATRLPGDAKAAEAIEALAKRDAALLQSLRALAMTLSYLGPGTETAPAPARRLMAEIASMAAECRAILDGPDGGSEEAALRFLANAAETTLHYAELSLAEIETRVSDIVELLARPKINTGKLLERLRRPEWLLDGWGVLVALWRRTEPPLRRRIAGDLAGLAPPLPTEVHEWFTPQQAREAPPRLARIITQGADWRSGQSLDITERNEDLISFSLHYENKMTPIGSTRPVGSDRVRIPKYRNKTRGRERTLTKTVPTGAPVPKEAGQLTENLSSASDENLLRIVAMIDRLPERSKLDVLLADIRPRLAQLRPPRPVTLTRLLFLPLTGALVDQADWRRDAATIPRTALHLISSFIGELLGEATQGMAKTLRHAVFSDIAIVEQFGQPLWEGAARIAERITPGMRWAEAGFTPEDFRAMMRLATGVWRHAPAIWKVVRLGDQPASVNALREALAGPADENLDIFAVAFRTLLRTIRNPSAFATLAAGGMPPGTSEIVIESLEEWINTALPKLPDYEPYDAVERAEEIGKTIETLGLTPFFQIPRRRRQLSAFFWRLEEYCRVMLIEIINEEILPIFTPSGEPFSDAAFAQLERQARVARRLEILGRHFGNDPMYDENQQRLIKAFSGVRKDMNSLSVTSVDLLRLGEILLGREKIRALLAP